MTDAEEPFRHDPVYPAPSTPEGIPLARPITVRYVEPGPLPAHEILLPGSSRLAALADVGVLILSVLALGTIAQLMLVLWVGWGIGGVGEPEADVAGEMVERALRIPGLICTAFATFAAISMILVFRRQSLQSVGVRRCGLALDCVIGIVAVIALYVVFLSATVVVYFLAPSLLDEMSENAELLAELIPNVGLLEFAGVAMIVGIYEEILFRGFLMTRLRRITGGWTPAVLISTVLFTAPHAFDQVSVALPMIAVLSLVFSVVTIWRRSIVPAVVAHALFDFVQFLFLGLQMGDSWT